MLTNYSVPITKLSTQPRKQTGSLEANLLANGTVVDIEQPCRTDPIGEMPSSDVQSRGGWRSANVFRHCGFYRPSESGKRPQDGQDQQPSTAGDETVSRAVSRARQPSPSAKPSAAGDNRTNNRQPQMTKNNIHKS